MIDQLIANIKKTNAPIVVGLDPMMKFIPEQIQKAAFAEYGETLKGAAEAIWQYNKGIVDAINWEIQVVNSTMQVLNDGKVRVDKESFNADIVALSKAISAKDDAKMAEEFQRVIPVFKQLGESVNEVIK